MTGTDAFEWTLQAVVTAVGVALTIAIFLATRRRDRRIKQAELLRNYTNDFYDDDRMTAVFMDVDHDRFSFGPADYGTERELSLIRILDFLNILGHNWQRRVISLEDVADTTLGYAIVRLSTNRSVVAYLRQIERWDAQRYSAGAGFGYFRELAVALAGYPQRSRVASAQAQLRDAIARRWYARALGSLVRRRALVPRRVATTVDAVAGSE